MQNKAFLHVDFEQPKELVFNRARMRRAFVTIGQVHMRDARRLVMRRGRSAPGENPAYRTGKLARSIGYYVPRASKRRPGLMVKIAPNQKNGEGNRHISGAFYPAFLFYGVRRGAKRKKAIIAVRLAVAAGKLLHVITIWPRCWSGGAAGPDMCCRVSCASPCAHREGTRNETDADCGRTACPLPAF